MNYFVYFFQNTQDIQAEIEKREVKYKKLNLTFQPSPIIVGEDLDHIVASYVRVNDILYTVETPLKAVEVTFKVILALNALYSKEAEQVWLLIQKAVFKLNTKFDSQFTSVNVILSNLL